MHPQLGREIELAVDRSDAGDRECVPAELVVVPELVAGLPLAARPHVRPDVARQSGEPGLVEQHLSRQVEPFIRVVRERDRAAELVDQRRVQRDAEGSGSFPPSRHRVELVLHYRRSGVGAVDRFLRARRRRGDDANGGE